VNSWVQELAADMAQGASVVIIWYLVASVPRWAVSAYRKFLSAPGDV